MNFRKIAKQLVIPLFALSLTGFAVTANAQSACKGLSSSQCGSNSSCSWVNGYTRSDGAKVKSFCRSKGKGGGISKNADKGTRLGTKKPADSDKKVKGKSTEKSTKSKDETKKTAKSSDSKKAKEKSADKSKPSKEKTNKSKKSSDSKKAKEKSADKSKPSKEKTKKSKKSSDSKKKSTKKSSKKTKPKKS